MKFSARFFTRWRDRVAIHISDAAHALRDQARDEGWHAPLLDDIVGVVETRRAHVLAT